MASFTPGKPGLALGIGLAAIVLGLVFLPFSIASVHGDYSPHFWWVTVVPIVGGLYFAITGAVALARRRSGSGS
jgi:hypothetical protein